MKIKSIEINNVKGISLLKKDFELTPNKVNIFVAPNGFGKTSLGIAFSYLSDPKIELSETDRHNKNETLIPNIKIKYEDTSGIHDLEANHQTNNIRDKFDVFVINSQLKASGTVQRYMGRSISKFSINIEPTILVNKIPEKKTFNYKISDFKKNFGTNSKILSDISRYIHTPSLLKKIIDEINIHELTLVRVKGPINEFIEKVNTAKGKTEAILSWVDSNIGDFLDRNNEIRKLTLIIHNYQFPTLETLSKSFLCAWQFIQLFNSHTKSQIEKIYSYADYVRYADYVTRFISDFNTTRFEIKPKSDGKKLVINWPKAHEISNGQRDILNFVALLLKARINLQKQNQILLIDEVFDYLDDANLISFQYFITDFIEFANNNGINIFPILLTHLDPNFFNHFCFSGGKLKVFYLKDFKINSSEHLHRLIYNREDPLIKDNVDTYFFHFHPDEIDIQNEFQTLGLVKEWGDIKKFHRKIYREVDNYLSEQEYDPLAICFALRKVVEKKAYDLIASEQNKQIFLGVHGTKNKLLYANSVGIELPESYFLLGIIYNTSLHLFNGQNITNSLASKLENMTIKNMIKEVCSN